MIDYIKYTINNQTYNLTNNGDGTWDRELNAPSVSGLYNLKLEIGQGGSVTYIDSSDPRYTFYLDVIEDIERKVDLVQYIPNFMQEVLEFNVIFDSENIELDRLYSSINKEMLDVFIRTASVEKITRFENFLRFKGEGSLEQRRSFLLSLFQKGKKMNEQIIKEVTHTITGSDCIVTFYGSDELNNPEVGFGLLQIQVLNPDNSKDYRYSDIARTLAPLVPSHIKLLVIKYFATWEDVKENFQDWNAIASLTNWKSLQDFLPPQ